MIDIWGEPLLAAIKRRALDGANGSFHIDLEDVWDYLHGVENTQYGREIVVD